MFKVVCCRIVVWEKGLKPQPNHGLWTNCNQANLLFEFVISTDGRFTLSNCWNNPLRACASHLLCKHFRFTELKCLLHYEWGILQLYRFWFVPMTDWICFQFCCIMKDADYQFICVNHAMSIKLENTIWRKHCILLSHPSRKTTT